MKTAPQNYSNRGFRTALSERIFLDRYALKAETRDDLKIGDTVIFTKDKSAKYPTREIGKVIEIERRDDSNNIAKLIIRDGDPDQFYFVDVDHLDLPLELDYKDMSARVAKHIASVEVDSISEAEAAYKFEEILADRLFVPAGRILSGAGAPGDTTFFNCYVLPIAKDSREGIIDTAKTQFEIMSRGGGVGINISVLRPKYDYVKGVNGRSSGAVAWADLYSFMTNKIEQGGSRRGALMIILDIWHPDIENFITAKHEVGFLDFANISVGITDEFMNAVEFDGDHQLVFPDRNDPDYDDFWDGDINKWRDAGKKVNVYKTVKARDLYKELCGSAWKSAEPGLFFVDKVNAESNSWYFNTLRCTNPCGEQALPGYGVCNLGAINLSRFVVDSEGFHSSSGFYDHIPGESYEHIRERVDFDLLRSVAMTATHFLDNVIEATPYFIDENEKVQKDERRIGLGIMGLAELFIRAGVRYGSLNSIKLTNDIFRTIRDAAYEKSTELAESKGSFLNFDADKLLQSGFSKRLPDEIKNMIRTRGLRNVTLTTVAPTGTTGSMTATSTGIEPYYMFKFEQRGHLGAHIVEESVVKEFRDATDYKEDKLPAHFVNTESLNVQDHVNIMSAAQTYIDASISKTMNMPNDATVEDVERLYTKLYNDGCKGGTVYRDGSRAEQCLVKVEEKTEITEEKSDESLTKNQGDLVEIPEPEVKRLGNSPRLGMTHSVMTHLGRVHVTLNMDEDGLELFDVFVRLSKAGSDVDANTDAIGRLISLALRLSSNIPSKRRLELVIEQLRGIASSQSYGIGKNKVRSVPDGIAICLRAMLDKMFAKKGNPIMPEITAVAKVSEKAKPKSSLFIQVCSECGCAAAVNIDGCFKCQSCGFSLC